MGGRERPDGRVKREEKASFGRLFLLREKEIFKICFLLSRGSDGFLPLLPLFLGL